MSLPLPRRFVLPLLGSSVALALLLGARPATAQVTLGTVNRDISSRGSTYNPLWINYSDCIKDGHIRFSVNLPSPQWQSDVLEVWVGTSTDCSIQSERTGGSPTCWNVYSAAAAGGTNNAVEVGMRDIVGQHKNTETPHGKGSGTVGDCNSGSGTQAVGVTLYFMLVDGAGNIDSTVAPATYTSMKYDLSGPDAPTGVSTGIAENQVKVSWTASPSGTDLVGYHIFCDPKPGASSAADSGAGAAGGSTGTGGAGGSTGSDAGMDAGGGTTGADAAAGSGGSTGSDGGSTINPDCPSTVLVTGQSPDPAYLCGEVRGRSTTSGYAKGLTNFQNYAIAVSGFDGVQNDGPLSEVKCGTPQPVNDFYDAYTQAGGKGGGGFCGIADSPAPGAGGAFVLALFAGILRRRRRHRS